MYLQRRPHPPFAAVGAIFAHKMLRVQSGEGAPLEVRVVERWIVDPARADEARAHIESVLLQLALRRLCGPSVRRPGALSDPSP